MFKLDYWVEDESQLHTRWYDEYKDAMNFARALKNVDNITSVTVSQVLYEYEAE